jgi:UDP-N-acetylmuramate--alanine ligase
MNHIHFLGIAGIGVSALAQVALARGACVSGSDPGADPQINPAIARLLAGGATLYREHRAENLVEDVNLVVASAAIAENNPEVQEALCRGVRVVSRAEFLGELMAAHLGPKIAIAGTHGKTTTTGMIGVMLQHAGLDPTVFVGGEVAQLGGNVRIGSAAGPFVAEACEAYDSFLALKPDIAVITNIEADHLDYYGTFDRVLDSFGRFVTISQNRPIAVLCVDDVGVQRLIPRTPEEQPRVTYGIETSEATNRAVNISLGRTAAFDWVSRRGGAWISLGVPGRHNVLNALAAAIVGHELGLSAAAIAAGLAEFKGAGRRQEILGEVAFEGGSVLVMDDYAHHPAEIRVTLEALRAAYPERRLVAIFQPHLYSRTRDFLPEFAAALSQADALIVTDVYAARETPIEGVQADDIVGQASKLNPHAPARFVPDKRDIPAELAALVRPNDLTVFLGAGDIRTQGDAFLSLLQRRAEG